MTAHIPTFLLLKQDLEVSEYGHGLIPNDLVLYAYTVFLDEAGFTYLLSVIVAFAVSHGASETIFEFLTLRHLSCIGLQLLFTLVARVLELVREFCRERAWAVELHFERVDYEDNDCEYKDADTITIKLLASIIFHIAMTFSTMAILCNFLEWHLESRRVASSRSKTLGTVDRFLRHNRVSLL